MKNYILIAAALGIGVYVGNLQQRLKWNETMAKLLIERLKKEEKNEKA